MSGKYEVRRTTDGPDAGRLMALYSYETEDCPGSKDDAEWCASHECNRVAAMGFTCEVIHIEYKAA